MYWITGILGVFLIIAPFVLGYSMDVSALWSSIILGVIVVVLSAIKGFTHDVAAKWEYWLVAITGLLAIVAPFVLNYKTQPRPLDASIILGAVVIVVAAYQLVSASSQTH